MIDWKQIGLLAIALFASATAQAQLRIDITSGVTDPVPIAIVPFVGAAVDVAEVVQADLVRSGRFKALARDRQPGAPTRAADVVAANWRAAGTDYVLVGRVVQVMDGAVAVDFELVNVLNGQRLLLERLIARSGAIRNAAHQVADRVYEKILGVKSAFATRIAYVSVDGAPPTQRFQLIVADADGENSRVILESKFPLMSPAWSPDGESLAYVSFETRRAAIYVQRVRTAERQRVSERPGVNGAPSWSPDGRKLALTLSSASGNLDVYVLDLDSRQYTRVTDDAGIDTEPVWSPDGTTIYFTSDRAGGPQIYRQRFGTAERAQRVTFSGSYNARPRVAADGLSLALVTREGSAYRVAVQDLRNGALRVLSSGREDESPAFSPDGGTLIFAGRERGRGVLATVSVDGLVLQRLKADRGDVRDPSWGPFSP